MSDLFASKIYMNVLKQKGRVIFLFILCLFLIAVTGCATVSTKATEDSATTPILETEPTDTPTAKVESTPTKEDLTPSPTPDATATAYITNYVATVDAQRSSDVPPLPFDDNPDPLQCGIPISWTKEGPAWLSGYYENELVRPTVFLYDSHLRLNIKAEAPHASEVKVLLYQQNPVTDYYLVKIVGAAGPNEGWVPAPFLSFEEPISQPVDQ